MDLLKKIEGVKKHLAEEKIDGWLIYDFQGMNPLARDFLEISSDAHITRRYFYWIPKEGSPIKIVPFIESHILDHLPGEKKVFLEWEVLHAALKEVLQGKKVVAMEYSSKCALPYVSKVDAGTIDLVRECGVEVVSSASFLQHYSCVWDDFMLKSHELAAKVLEDAVDATWSHIAACLKENISITEYEVSQFILGQIHKAGCIMDGEPICAFNENSANPHYGPSKEGSKVLQKGDLILIDLWCKKKEERSVYADITRIAVAGKKLPEEIAKVFKIVRLAQKTATDFIQEKLDKKQIVKGFEADRACRKVIEDAGFGKYFTHRTGHNIHINAHGPGAHLDSLETLDDRPLIAKTCFSIEPGIYLPGKFGIRLEYDVYIKEDGKLVITGGIQEEAATLA